MMKRVCVALAALAAPAWAHAAEALGGRIAEQEVRTPVLRPGDAAVRVSVDVSGVTSLYLGATTGGDTYNFDQAVWCEPRLVKADGQLVDLTELPFERARTGYTEVHAKAAKVADKSFKKAWYAHAPSVMQFDLSKLGAVRFEAWVGLEGSNKKGSAAFVVSAKEPAGVGAEPMTDTPPASAAYAELPPTANVPVAQAKVTYSREAAQVLLDKGVKELLFVRRFTLQCSHSYTEFIDSKWMPGGSLCLLDVASGRVTELTPESMREGVINRFDLSWDAKRVVFDYKGGAREPYCLYEVGLDGRNLRQLTFRAPDYDALMQRYGIAPNDMHPCYLQDGSILFSSSRCQVSVLCNAGDVYPATTLYRMDADGQNLRQVSYNLLSEFSPAVLPDGRVLYMRWEYNRKGAGEIKCLWSMRPDGSGVAEVYGNLIQDPETMLYGRPIPGSDKISFLGCSHWGPNNAVGTIIVLDTKKDVSSAAAMRIVTPDVVARTHGGFTFLVDGKYVDESTGRPGRLFKDPYPLSESLLLAVCKPKGYRWDAPNGYHLVLVDEAGKDTLLLRDEGISVWHPYPVAPRKAPPMVGLARNAELAERQLAQCLLTDVYSGLEGVPRGEVAHVRVMEQVPRPWAARNVWPCQDKAGDKCGMAHTALGPRVLGLHVSHGVVPVEQDGSANFLVPANRNIYFQLLDAEGRAIQTERTVLNYMPGEVRGCVGCHERAQAGSEAVARTAAASAAMRRKPSVPAAEPGLAQAGRVFDYERQVQPIFSAQCVRCHGDDKPAGGLSLSGKRTKLFCESYEQLTKRDVVGKQANENDVRTGDTEYKKPYFYGARSSLLAAMFDTFAPCFDGFPGKGELMARRLAALREQHRGIALSARDRRLLSGWLDASCQYHPSYWGQKNAEHQSSPFFRPAVTLEEALAPTWPERFSALYAK